MIAAQMRPQKVSSIPLDKNIMDWKKLDINKEKSRFMNEDLREKQSEHETDSVSNSANSVPENFNFMQDQRTKDLMNNISRHALPKKVQVFKDAFVNSEAVKIKKFQNKCKRQEFMLKFITQKHDEIMKTRTIKRILKEEQDKEIELNKEWYNALVFKEKQMRDGIVHKKEEDLLKEKLTMKATIQRSHSHQNLKKNSTMFYNAFAQAKNIIEKQISLGIKLKTRNQMHKMLSERIKTQKSNKMGPLKPIEIKREAEVNYKSTSALTSNNNSIYQGGDYLLSKYKIKSNNNKNESGVESALESYSTTMHKYNSEIIHGSVNHSQIENNFVEESDVILKDIFGDKKLKRDENQKHNATEFLNKIELSKNNFKGISGKRIQMSPAKLNRDMKCLEEEIPGKTYQMVVTKDKKSSKKKKNGAKTQRSLLYSKSLKKSNSNYLPPVPQ